VGLNRFKRARLEKGLRQIDIARAAGIGEGYVSRIETGRVEPGPDLVRRIAQALNIDPDYFARDSSDSPRAFGGTT
jgi:transcriptional regulator with XRE-family HTH domain